MRSNPGGRPRHLPVPVRPRRQPHQRARRHRSAVRPGQRADLRRSGEPRRFAGGSDSIEFVRLSAIAPAGRFWGGRVSVLGVGATSGGVGDHGAPGSRWRSREVNSLANARSRFGSANRGPKTRRNTHSRTRKCSRRSGRCSSTCSLPSAGWQAASPIH